MHFKGLALHPSVSLIVWMATVLLIQFVAYPVHFLIALCILVRYPGVLPSALRHIWRARWLICVLWLVLAFNTPGEAFQSLAWMPTYEGMADANIQTVRLLLTLLCLAWLFYVLEGERLLAGLYGVLMPLEKIGLKVSTLLVRLALVMESLQTPPSAGSWRQMLSMPVGGDVSRTTIGFTIPPWRLRDGAVLFGFALIIAGGVFC